MKKDQIIEKQAELIKSQEITISYFLKYSGESERITRFMNVIKEKKVELAALQAEELSDEPVLNPECRDCGHHNSENCNTCRVLNPQFDGV